MVKENGGPVFAGVSRHLLGCVEFVQVCVCVVTPPSLGSVKIQLIQHQNRPFYAKNQLKCVRMSHGVLLC